MLDGNELGAIEGLGAARHLKCPPEWRGREVGPRAKTLRS